MSKSRIVIFVGAGTAGHIEPALAVARAWQGRYPDDRCIFLGTPTGLENTLVPQAGFELCNIEKVVMPRSINADLVKLPYRLIRSVKSAKSHIKGSDLLIGFGGYASASAYIAARFSNVPVVIHEANAKVGWANKLGSLFTEHLATARPIGSGRFSRAQVTGMPLRKNFHVAYALASADWHKARMDAKTALGWNHMDPTLLVIGGSLGSIDINAKVLDCLPALMERNMQILHSVGSKNALPPSRLSYRAVPYIEDMATAYLAADVMIARSGAVTCAEFATLGRMAVFVPLPIGNGEQTRNADQLVKQGRAVVVGQKNFSAKWLEDNIAAVIEQSKKCDETGSSQDLEADERIVEIMEEALRGRNR